MTKNKNHNLNSNEVPHSPAKGVVTEKETPEPSH